MSLILIIRSSQFTSLFVLYWCNYFFIFFSFATSKILLSYGFCINSFSTASPALHQSRHQFRYIEMDSDLFFRKNDCIYTLRFSRFRAFQYVLCNYFSKHYLMSSNIIISLITMIICTKFCFLLSYYEFFTIFYIILINI